MTRHVRFAHRDYTRILKNHRGRLSPCECCCPDLPASLFLHLVPTFKNEFGAEIDGCRESDQGPPASNGAYPLPADIASGNCNDWTTDNFVDEPDPICWGGARAEPFGIEATLACIPVNQFRLDICWGAFATGNPEGFPNDTSNCDRLDAGLIANESTAKTCDAEPGEFFLDFGTFQPPFCECLFQVYVNEIAADTEGEDWPYAYPAEARGAFGPGVRRMLQMFESTPGIGTPPQEIVDGFG